MMERSDRPLRSRLEELEARFTELAARMADSPEKEAISVLHAMLQEGWSEGERRSDDGRAARTLEEVAGLWRQAPPMEGVAQNEPLPVGTQAPDFALPDADGRTVRLSDFRGRPVVLVFYPLDWSPGCSRQLDLYQMELDEFERRGAKVLGISVDSIYSHGAWAAVRGIAFPLLADFHPKGEVARRYRVWRESDGFSERALYVVDPEGVIRYAYVAPQLPHVPDPEELFRTLDELAAAPAGAG